MSSATPRRLPIAAKCGLLLTAGLAMGALPTPVAASSQTCQRDAIIVLQQVRQARADLSEAATGSERARCAAWRNQIAALKKAAAFYGRCQSGAERSRNVANANAGVAEYSQAVTSQCGGN